MHVAFFNRSFYPDTAATGQLLTELCESLVATHGCRVSVVAGVPLQAADGRHRRVRGLVQRERYRGIEILRARGTRLSKRRFVGRASNYLTYFLSACYAGLRLERPDIVVAQTDPPIIGLAGYLAARRFGAPFVMAYKDIFPEVARLLEDFQSETVNRVLDGVTCFLARKADRVVALGETMRRTLIEGKGADPAKTVVISDWADCAAIAPGPKQNEFARAHGLDEKFVVMHSGNIGLSQALETVVEAADALRSVGDLEVVFVGDGVKKAALQEEVRARGLTNVRFLPLQPKERLGESFASADVFVISLKVRMAGYVVPSKLYGILAAGRPYVAAVEEASEVAVITRRYDCGLLAEPGKAADLADKILELYRNRLRAGQLGANARRAAREFDRPRQVSAYYGLFCKLGGVSRRKVLFVCTRDVARAPMAAALFCELVGRDAAPRARTAATAYRSRHHLTTRDLAWSDVVAVMEERHRQEISTLWPNHASKVVVLDVPDDYDPGESALRETLTPKVQALVDQLDTLARRLRVPKPPILKRPFDVLLSRLGLLVSAPLWAVIALLIKLHDGGPVFYAQERVGKDGRRFRSLKFRSMVPDAEQGTGPLQASDVDARVTRIGRWLRATALDELPQLWNISRGDMSFVGPRALRPLEIEVNGAGQVVPIEQILGYAERHRVTPGLTGLAQVYADRDIPRRHKFKYDLLYIRRQSFCLDLRLILLSFWITARGRWERRGAKF